MQAPPVAAQARPDARDPRTNEPMNDWFAELKHVAATHNLAFLLPVYVMAAGISIISVIMICSFSYDHLAIRTYCVKGGP